MKKNWKPEAERLFFIERKKIGEIAALIGVSRRSVSGYLHNHPGFAADRADRKKDQEEHRREYQREWDRSHRLYTGAGPVTADTMRQEHDVAVLILSREKY